MQASEAIAAIAKAFKALPDSEKQAQMKKVRHPSGHMPSLTIVCSSACRLACVGKWRIPIPDQE